MSYILIPFHGRSSPVASIELLITLDAYHKQMPEALVRLLGWIPLAPVHPKSEAPLLAQAALIRSAHCTQIKSHAVQKLFDL